MSDKVKLEICPGESNQDYQTANFLNAIDQVVAFYTHSQSNFKIQDQDVVDALRMYADQYQRDTIGP